MTAKIKQKLSVLAASWSSLNN